MGLAVASILLTTSALSPPAILGAILAAGMLQGVCDPTNTYNVWIAGFQGITVNQILRYTLLPIWAAAIAIAVVGIFGVNRQGRQERNGQRHVFGSEFPDRPAMRNHE
jgi:hypothetical protein